MPSEHHRPVAAPASRRRLLRIALPVVASTLVTASVIGVSVGRSGSQPRVQAAGSQEALSQAARSQSRGSQSRGAQSQVLAAPSPAPTASADSRVLADRSAVVSRSAKRVTLKPKPKVTDHEFMTARLNLWPSPREKGKPLAVLPERGKVAVTGVTRAAFAQILRDGQVRWVKKAYLVDKLPEPRPTPDDATGTGTVGASAGLSSAPCPDGSGTESGLTSSAVRLFRAACAAFPALSSYGGYDNHGEHSSGRAIDFMTSDSSLGQALADWARAHASELDLYDVIWAQHIWTPVRSGEGWRSMSDRGSSTANHYDHVHIAVN